MSYQFLLPCGLSVTVSDRDKKLVKSYRWYKSRSERGSYYVVGYKRGGSDHRALTRLHRLIMKPRPGQFVDHRDCNTLNNVRRNLRICTPAQSTLNSGRKRKHKKYKGVYKNRYGKWWAQIYVNRKSHYYGSFETIDEAAIAYNKAAKRLHGRFANLNVIQ